MYGAIATKVKKYKNSGIIYISYIIATENTHFEVHI